MAISRLSRPRQTWTPVVVDLYDLYDVLRRFSYVDLTLVSAPLINPVSPTRALAWLGAAMSWPDSHVLYKAQVGLARSYVSCSPTARRFAL